MGRHNEFSDEELELLSEEERAGLLDTSLVDDDDETTAEPVQTDDEEAATDAAAQAAVEQTTEESDTPTKEEASADDADESDDAAGEQQPAAPEKSETPDATAEPPAHRPRPASALPAYQAPQQFEAQMQDLRSRQEELAQKFDDGELAAKEFHQQRTALDDKIADLREARLKASMSEEAQIHHFTNVTVPNWLSQHDDLYAVGTPPYVALDAEVRRLQMQEGADPFDPALLDQAHATVSKYFVAPAGAAPEKPGKEAPKPTDKRVIPPTLGGVPAAGDEDIGDGGKFAYLDRLVEKNPLAFEAELAKLSDTDREAYLAS